MVLELSSIHHFNHWLVMINKHYLDAFSASPCHNFYVHKLIKYNIVSKKGFKGLSFSKPSSLLGIPLPHNSWFNFMVFAISRHAILRLSILIATQFFSATTSTFFLLIEILVILPCSLLDKISNAYPHAPL